eukprot:11850084-Karenia_brevis.AAC.1
MSQCAEACQSGLSSFGRVRTPAGEMGVDSRTCTNHADIRKQQGTVATQARHDSVKETAGA